MSVKMDELVKTSAEKLNYCVTCGEYYDCKGFTSKHCSERCMTRGTKCKACGFLHPLAMHVHHIKGRKSKRVMVLCANCHSIFHRVAGNKLKDYYRDTARQVVEVIRETF